MAREAARHLRPDRSGLVASERRRLRENGMKSVQARFKLQNRAERLLPARFGEVTLSRVFHGLNGAPERMKLRTRTWLFLRYNSWSRISVCEQR
jgi:hypothetical protein